MFKNVYNSYEDLMSLMNESNREYDYLIIEKAYMLASKAHKGQIRKSGEPYIVHPVSVACILVELGLDSEAIIAAILHDTVEDTDITIEYIEKKFGKTIANLIDGLTKLEKLDFVSREERQAENIRKMFIKMNEDIRVIIIKLADRLNNIRTLDALSKIKQRMIAHETLEIFAPIAHRLGIRAIKEELEDTALRYIDSFGYEEIQENLEKNNKTKKDFTDKIIIEIRHELGEKYKHLEMSGRVKSIYGIYKKLFNQQCQFNEIFDVYAVRIIVDEIEDCYHVLGVIHQMFIPIPKRFKDYITMPKPNGYQSLHTTVFSKRDKIPFEVQIRTREMHQNAEYGVAAHWKYKAGIGPNSSNMDKAYVWIRNLLDTQNDSDEIEEIISHIKNDIMPEEVYVFTPRGDVKQLPQGSTVIDFAYAIHTAVGNKMVGAKVDSKMVPISYEVSTGEVVEILTTKDPNHGPSRDWLKIVKTSEARSKIRTWFKKERREENIEEGTLLLTRELRRNSIPFNAELTKDVLLDISQKYDFETVDDFLAAIGYGGVALSRAVPRIADDYKKRANPDIEQDFGIKVGGSKKEKTAQGVIINNTTNLLVKFSKCCNPLPGDEIIGFITRGYGVSIHKSDCSNVPDDIRLSAEPERWVKAEWESKMSGREYKCTLEIAANDRQGLILDISKNLFDMHLNIQTMNTRPVKNDLAYLTITFMTSGREHVEAVISKIKRVKGVISIERTRG